MTAQAIAEWTPACMESDELAGWQGASAMAQRHGSRPVLPCQDCLSSFAAEMRAVGRCNGTPRGDKEDTIVDQPVTPDHPRSLPIARRVALDLAAPPCESCAHEPVCSLRAALEGLADVETMAPRLPDGLSLTLRAVVSCAHYLRGRSKPAPAKAAGAGDAQRVWNGEPFNGPKRTLSPEARQRMAEAGRASAARARAAKAAKRAAAAEGRAPA